MELVSEFMWAASPESPEEGSSYESERSRHWDSERVSENLCSHFSVSVVDLAVPGIYPPMQVPIYHCALAEEMVARLRTTPEGHWLADRLEAPPLEGQTRLICGPDLEAITTTTCIPDRCHRSCRAGFSQILTDLNIESTPPEG